MECDVLMTNLSRHFFAGSNSSKGFYSLFSHILNKESARKIICMKGGPGTGKSSFMKKVGGYFSKKGYPIEYYHCSSDINSLDAIVIKNLNIALLDGTFPHARFL